MDEIHGSLIAYEMRISNSKSTDREANFKENKNIKEK